MEKRARAETGHMLFWLLMALTIFSLLLVPAVQGGTTSRKSILLRQRALERSVETHRIARWVSAHGEKELLRLPAAPSAALPGAWGESVRAQTAFDDSDALRGGRVLIGVEPDVEGCVRLHRITVELQVPDGNKTEVVRVERMVTLR